MAWFVILSVLAVVQAQAPPICGGSECDVKCVQIGCTNCPQGCCKTCASDACCCCDHTGQPVTPPPFMSYNLTSPSASNSSATPESHGDSAAKKPQGSGSEILSCDSDLAAQQNCIANCKSQGYYNGWYSPGTWCPCSLTMYCSGSRRQDGQPDKCCCTTPIDSMFGKQGCFGYGYSCVPNTNPSSAGTIAVV
jgi:hypothetical protein